MVGLHAKRTVVRSDDLQVVVAQGAPQVLLVVWLAQRRRHDVFGGLKVIVVVDRVVKQQVVRACFGKHWNAFGARAHDMLERVVTRDMHKVNGGIRKFSQSEAAVRSLSLHKRGAGERVVARRGVTGFQRLLDQQVDHRAVFGV